MYRTSKHSQGRRSSQPKRLSSVLQEPDERSSKCASDGKKTHIPRPTGLVRSSSMERDDVRSSCRTKIPRCASTERISAEGHGGKLDRARSIENLFTPQNVMKTSGPSSSRSTGVSVRRTARKDTRPLTDRGFQNVELGKVHVYLSAENIVTEQQMLDVRCPMTTKLFVHVMNCLLQKLFPTHSVTISNYCEQIPSLMKKLKYPGNVARSWLLSANSPHAWPHVLGLMAWLTDLLNLSTPNLKYVAGEDNVLDNDRVIKLHAFTAKRYLEWSENEGGFCTNEDEKFFDKLVVDRKELLAKQLMEIQQDLQALQVLENQTPEERAADEAFKKMKTELAKKKSAVNHDEEMLQNAYVLLEKAKNEKTALLKERENIMIRTATADSTKTCTIEELEKLRSEVISLKNMIKMQDTHITDLNNHCYTDDLILARVKGKLDQVRLKRSAQLRECISEYVDTSQLDLPLTYGTDDNSHTVAEFQDNMKKAKWSAENILIEYKEKEKTCKLEIHEAEENIRKCKENISETTRLQHVEEEVNTQKKKIIADLRNEIGNRSEVLSKWEGECIVLEMNLEKANSNLTSLEKQTNTLQEMIQAKEEKYNKTVELMNQELHNYVKKCEVSVQRLFK